MKKVNRFLGYIKRVFLKFFVITFFLSLFNVASAAASDYSEKAEIKYSDKNIMPILMSTDNGYVYPTLVSMTSMVKNKKRDTFLKFNIMVSGDTSGENRKKFKKFGNIYRKDCSVKIINMGNRFRGIAKGYFPPSAYYRLLASSYLPHYNKILYVDGDTLIRHDLSNLFDTDIDKYYIAGGKDIGMPVLWAISEQDREKRAKILGIKDMNQYINSGVLLMNLRKFREDNLEGKFLNYVRSGGFLRFADQDVFNSVCYGKINILSPIYNDLISVLTKFYNKGNRPEEFATCCSKEEWERSFDDPVIVHYAGDSKPWNNSDVAFFDEWKEHKDNVEDNFYKTIENGIYTIESALNHNMVLDISSSSRDNGANLQLWDSNGTNAQKFHVFHVGGGLYEIAPMCSGKRVDVDHSGKSNGTNIWQWEANGTDAQKWYINPVGNGYYNIVSKCNGLCLDVHGSQTEKGTNIWCYGKNGTNAQKFKFRAA